MSEKRKIKLGFNALAAGFFLFLMLISLLLFHKQVFAEIGRLYEKYKDLW